MQHKRLVVYTRGQCIITTEYFGVVFCRQEFIWVIFCLGGWKWFGFFLLVCASHSLAFVFESRSLVSSKNIRSSSFCERSCEGENSKKKIHKDCESLGRKPMEKNNNQVI